MRCQPEEARTALRLATYIRKKAGCGGLATPICIYDVCEALGVKMRFIAVPSLEGMYASQSDTIIVSALRPKGRQAYNAAHELGHRQFGHGDRIDEVAPQRLTNEKRRECQLADMFAGYLLMPHRAIASAFSERGWKPDSCNALQIYTIASQFGVGYETLIKHLLWSLQKIHRKNAEALLRIPPKQVRRSVLGHDESRHLLIADKHWQHVPIDLQVGDYAMLPAGIELETQVAEVDADEPFGTVIVAQRPGITRAICSSQD